MGGNGNPPAPSRLFRARSAHMALQRPPSVLFATLTGPVSENLAHAPPLFSPAQTYRVPCFLPVVLRFFCIDSSSSFPSVSPRLA